MVIWILMQAVVGSLVYLRVGDELVYCIVMFRIVCCCWWWWLVGLPCLRLIEWDTRAPPLLYDIHGLLSPRQSKFVTMHIIFHLKQKINTDWRIKKIMNMNRSSSHLCISVTPTWSLSCMQTSMYFCARECENSCLEVSIVTSACWGDCPVK